MTDGRETEARFNWRLPITVAIAAFVYLLGGSIPIPGLDPDALGRCMESSPGCLQRVSILALGLLPLLYILMPFEMLKLVFPHLAGRVANYPSARRWAATVIVALSLLFAASYGIDVYTALMASGFFGDDTLSMVIAVTSLVAGVATLMFLARTIRLPGIALGGFWLILSLSFSADFFAGFSGVLELARSGVVSVTTVAVSLGLVCAAVALVVFAATALVDRVTKAGGDAAYWSPILVWPPFIGGSLANLAAGIFHDFTQNQSNPLLWHFTIAWVAAFVLILPLVVFLYARSIRLIYPQQPEWSGRTAILSLIALVQVVICVGFILAPEFFPIFLGQGSALIALVVVLWALWRAVRPRVRRAPANNAGLRHPG